MATRTPERILYNFPFPASQSPLLLVVRLTSTRQMHLHGHDFVILQQAEGRRFSPDALDLKLDNPPRRDVALLPRNGFLVVAFRADNPGTWLMHCHIAGHAARGLALQVLERRADADALFARRGAAPAAKRLCAAWADWRRDCRNWWPGGGAGCVAAEELGAYAFQDDSGV